MTLLRRLRTSEAGNPVLLAAVKAYGRRQYQKGHEAGRAEAELEAAEAEAEAEAPTNERWEALAEFYEGYPEHIRESARLACERGEL